MILVVFGILHIGNMAAFIYVLILLNFSFYRRFCGGGHIFVYEFYFFFKNGWYIHMLYTTTVHFEFSLCYKANFSFFYRNYINVFLPPVLKYPVLMRFRALCFLRHFSYIFWRQSIFIFAF